MRVQCTMYSWMQVLNGANESKEWLLRQLSSRSSEKFEVVGVSIAITPRHTFTCTLRSMFLETNLCSSLPSLEQPWNSSSWEV